MKKNITLLLAVVMAVVSCHKPDDYPKPVPPPVSDARTVLLKDVVVERLPSPYFHFEYNDSNFVTNINFASSLLNYEVQYENKRVKRMINTIGRDSLEYSYANTRVAYITRKSNTLKRVSWRYDFTYNLAGQLQQIRWWAFPVSASDSELNRKVTFNYYPDGNLLSYNDYGKDTSNNFVLVNQVTFKDYDDGVNVDDFYLVKNFFEDVLFLPQVKLQKNNPRHVTMTGWMNDYEIDYSYQYNSKKQPTVKSDTILQTRGDHPGLQTLATTEYSYY